MSRKNPKEVRVGRSRAGLGLFAMEAIKKGDFVIEYVGDHVSSDEADERGGKYLFTVLDDKLVIDGSTRKNTARYINHSCRPNCEAEVDEDAKKVFIYAIKNIKEGDELTYHYGKEYWDDHIKPVGCKCTYCLKKKAQPKRKVKK